VDLNSKPRISRSHILEGLSRSIGHEKAAPSPSIDKTH
jgi:hypothetical protein